VITDQLLLPFVMNVNVRSSLIGMSMITHAHDMRSHDTRSHDMKSHDVMPNIVLQTHFTLSQQGLMSSSRMNMEMKSRGSGTLAGGDLGDVTEKRHSLFKMNMVVNSIGHRATRALEVVLPMVGALIAPHIWTITQAVRAP
jgi:hypothetical protein